MAAVKARRNVWTNVYLHNMVRNFCHYFSSTHFTCS